MDIYESKKDKPDIDVNKLAVNTLATGLGLVLGALAAASLESLLIWLILTYLVGVTITWLQVLGVMLIVNGVLAKFK
jgi:hypothetical protein